MMVDKDVMISLRINSYDLAFIDKRANRCGMSRSDFIRYSIIGSKSPALKINKRGRGD